MASQEQLLAAGREAGRLAGEAHGRRDGACRSAAQTVAPAAYPLRPLTVLFVPQGFPAIDEGVADALRQHAQTVHVGHSTTMLAQAAELRPQLVLVMNGLHVFPPDHAEQIAAIRALGIRTAIWFADDPYFTRETARLAPLYDVVFTHELEAVPFYRASGAANAHYLPLGANPAVFHAKPVGQEYRSDVFFVGTGFWNRIRLLDEVLPALEGRKVVLAGGEWERLARYSRYKPFIRPGFMPVEETVNFYNGAKIVLNIHRTTEPGSDNHNDAGLRGASINPRTYEISACGTLQLTDIRDDLRRYYEPGRELDVFTTPAELTAKILHYLDHEDERRRIAVRGMLRTMRDHAFAGRLGMLLDRAGC